MQFRRTKSWGERAASGPDDIFNGLLGAILTPRPTDAELVQAARAGQRTATAALIRRWTPRVVAVCCARVRRPAVAEDLAQEVLLRALQALPTLQQPDRFGPWVSGIAARTCLDWLKARARTEVQLDARVPCSRTPDGAAAATDRDQVDELSVAIQALPEPLREVIMLYYYVADRPTYDELAGWLGVSAATINARLTQARAMLRSRLASRSRR